VHKRALPARPKRLAIISSASGAAIADVLAVLGRRFPLLDVVLLPVAVQGEDAEAQVLRALARTPATGADVVLVTRGGGSLEDLWTFNLETVARAVRACPLPTVVAIGHETDFTIAEFAADLRAPTPSAAAELIVPDAAELRLVVVRHGAALTRSISHRMVLAHHRLDASRARLRDPRERLRQLMQRADDIEARLAAAAWRRLRDLSSRTARLERTRRAYHPARIVAQRTRTVDALERRNDGAMRAAITRGTAATSALARTLRAVSPVAVLERGYAIVTRADGDLLRSAEGIAPGDQLDVRLARGRLAVEVRSAGAPTDP
jgi:exodeoxyribonuclease VII large subunit